MRKILLIFITMSLLLLLGGCSKLRPYRVDVQQGNIIDQHTATELHTGLNKNEVAAILGAPLLTDMFNTNTWTYVYTNQINGGKIEKKKLILEFKKDKLVQINQ
ncbi:Outer membrane protein assembly factor BamE [Gammaproteobacteria bacterium]